MSGKLKKFCKVTKWIEQNDKSLYGVIDDLCLHGLFNPHGHNGITWLHPDSKLKAQIIKDAYSMDKVKDAVNVIKSLIILDSLPDLSSWNAKKDDIPNALRQKIEVVSVDGKQVKLNSGGIVTPEKSFVPMDGRDNMMVYQLKGNVGVSGSAASFKNAKKGGVRGGRTPHEKKQLAVKLENCYVESLKKETSSPYLSAVVSFLEWCKNNSELHEKVKCCLDPSPIVSFYILFAPHGSNSVVDNDTFNQWQNETQGFHACENPWDYYSNCLKSAEDKNKDRRNLLENPNKTSLSEDALKCYAGNNLKAAQDEFRFLVNQALMDIQRQPQSADLEWNNLCWLLRNCLNFSDPSNQVMILDQKIQMVNDVAAWISGPIAFVRSDFFLYNGVSNSGETSGAINSTQPVSLTKRYKEHYEKHYGKSQQAVSNTIRALRAVFSKAE